MSHRIRKGRRALAIAGALLIVAAPAAWARPIDAPPAASRSAPPAPVDLRSADAKAAELESRAVPAVAVDLRSPDAKAAEIESGAVQGVAVDLRSADAKAAEIASGAAVPGVASDLRSTHARTVERPARGGRLVVLARPAGPRDAGDVDWRAAGIGAGLLTIALLPPPTTRQRARPRAGAAPGPAPAVPRCRT